MVMAAGLGTRLRPFTDILPKPLLPLLGVPIAQYAVDALVHAGVSRIVANIHHLPEKSREGFSQLYAPQTELLLSDESQLLLGSAGGIRKALPLLTGDERKPFLLMNADTLCDINLSALMLRHIQLRSLYGVKITLTVLPQGPAGGKYRELFIDYKRGLLRGLGELQEAKPFFAGVAVIEPEAVEHLADDAPAEFVPDVLKPAIEQQRVGVYFASGTWIDIGSPELWFNAHWRLLEALAEGKLSDLWLRRIERENRRVGKQAWVSRAAPSVLDVTGWCEPCYWAPYGGADSAPRAIGPRAVVYGPLPSQAVGSGISLNGTWVPVA